MIFDVLGKDVMFSMDLLELDICQVADDTLERIT